MELWSRSAGVETWGYVAMEPWSSGGALWAQQRGGIEYGVLPHCRSVDVEAYRYDTLEARCGHSNVEAWASGALYARRRLSDVEVWRYGGVEARCRRVDVDGLRYSSAVGVQTWKYGSMGSRAMEARCRCADMEVWR